MLAPVQQLPDELLSAIFNYCLPEKQCFRTDCAPLVLTQVCSKWRTVAFDTHELWTSLSLNGDNLGCKQFMPLLYMWLDFSDERLIDIDVDITRINIRTLQLTIDKYHARQKTYQNLMAALYPEYWRVRALQGVFPVSIATSLVLYKMKALQKLNLIGFPDLESHSEPALIDMSKRLPHLKMLTLDNLPVNLRSLHSQTQLARIELSELRSPSWLNSQEAISLLDALPKLEIVSLNLNRPDDNISLPALTRLELPMLRFLYINWEDIVDPRAFFGAFAAPNLERLCLLGTLHGAADGWGALRDFVRASAAASGGGSRLKRLSVGDTGVIDLYLADVLRAAPALEYLNVNHGLITAPLLRALVWDVDDPAQQLVPKLATLRIGACPDFEDEDVLPVAQTRAHLLKEILLRQCAGLRVENEKYIRATGIENVVLDSDKTVLAPFGGLLSFMRVVEDISEFLRDDGGYP